MKKITSLLLIFSILNLTLPLRAFASTGTALEVTYSSSSTSTSLSASDEANLFATYKNIMGWDDLIANYGATEQDLIDIYNEINWDCVSTATGLDVKALFIAAGESGVDLASMAGFSFSTILGEQVGDSQFDWKKILAYGWENVTITFLMNIFHALMEHGFDSAKIKSAAKAAGKAEVEILQDEGEKVIEEKEEEKQQNLIDESTDDNIAENTAKTEATIENHEIEQSVIEDTEAAVEEEVATAAEKTAVKTAGDVVADVIEGPAGWIALAIHLAIELIKLFREYDTEDSGVVVYQSSNAIIDPAVNSKKYSSIENTETGEKASIGILVRDVHSKESGSNSYVYNTTVLSVAFEAGSYGYVHKNSGAAKQSEVGGVMNSSFTVYAGAETAGGIYTRDSTSFSGGTVTTEENVELELGVSYNNIVVADGLRSPEKEFEEEGLGGDVDVYGIYANGNWSAIKVIENNIIALSCAGDAVGIDIEDNEFSKEMIGNNIYVSTYTGAASGIRFNLGDDDGTLEIDTISGATTNNSPTSSLLFSMLKLYDSSASSNATEADELASIINDYFGDDSSRAIIVVKNSDGDDGDDDSTSATGILFTGGSFTVGSISDYNIIASSEGSGAYGIAFDYSSVDYTITVTEIKDIDIVVNSTGGLAVGVYLDTNYYDGDSYADTFIGTISNVDVTVSTYGNVYGYAAGVGFGYNNADGGFGFYNSGTSSSEGMATDFQYDTISLNVTSYGANDAYSGANAYGVYLNLYTATDINFERIEVGSVVEAYGLYLDFSTLSTFSTELVVNALGDRSHGVYLTNYSMLMTLDSSIFFKTASIDNLSGVTLIGVEVKSGSTINNISSDISFDLGGLDSDFIINAIYIDDADCLTGTFSGTLSVTSTSTFTEEDGTEVTINKTSYTDENFYGYLLGTELLSGESLLLYNEDTKNSEGITIDEDNMSISISYLKATGEDKNVYGAYITGSEYEDIEIGFDISVSSGVGLAICDGATASLAVGTTVSGSTNIVDGAGSTLTVIDGSFLAGGATVSNFAVLYIEGDRSISSSIFSVDSSASLEISGNVDLKSVMINISDSAYLTLVDDIDFYSSSLKINDGATLILDATTALYFDESSTMTVKDGYIVLDLSTDTEMSDYTIATVDDADAYETILSYLTDTDITSVILSDAFSNQTYNYATYGDNTGDMVVSYSARFTGDGTAINVTVVADAVFDYFKWVLDEYGNYQLELATYDDQSFSAYSSKAEDLERIVNEIRNEDINYSFVYLSSPDGGGAIYSKASSGNLYIGNITGDFVGNYGTSSGSVRGGAIYNYTSSNTDYVVEMGSISGDFIGNYVYSESEFTRGGAISNMSDGGSITMGVIYGDFKGNYAYTVYATSSSQGGAIYNYTGAHDSLNDYTSITMKGIEGDFIGNYVFSNTGKATGGAIFNESYGVILIEYITGDFIGNYVSSLSATASGGAIYNDANGTGSSSIIDELESSFIGNYAYSETDSATGGAIYNHAADGAISIISLYATQGDIEFTGNYTQVGDTKSSSAIYNYADSTSYTTINFVTSEDYSIIVNDAISGNSSTMANQILNIDGNVSFNNSVENQTIKVNSGLINAVLTLGSYEGTDDLYDNDTFIAVEASSASLSNVSLSVAKKATLNVDASEVSVSNSSSITLEDGSTLNFDLYGGLIFDETSTFTMGEDVTISVDFTGIYEEFNYTLFDFSDEDTYKAVLDYLTVNLDLTLSDDIIKSLNDEISISDIEYGDTLSEVEGEYSLRMNYDDVDYTISLELDFTGDLTYFKWTTDANGNLVLEAVDILAEVGTEDLDDILNDFDFSAYSRDNTRIQTSSADDIDYSFISLSSSAGAAVYLSATDTDLTIANISGDFVANKASSSTGDALGGAIYNSSGGATVSYVYITGTFLANSATSTSNDAKGGVIYNTTSASTSSVHISGISGDFESNYANATNGDALGGAISNENFGGTVQINNISANFDGNYAYSTSDNALGGAIYNYAEGGTVKINDISSSFDGNYTYSTSGNALGGAIYNSANGTSSYVYITITGDYTNNYAYSATGSALGGAIYNSATDGGEIHMTLDATSYNITFSGNYINEAGEISSNAIYNYADEDSTSTINFVSNIGTSITLNDAISGGSDYIENQILNINAVAIFNNTIENQTIKLNSAYLSFGSYTDSSSVTYTASLVDSTLSVDTGATLIINTSDVSVSNSTITFEDGSTLCFSLNASRDVVYTSSDDSDDSSSTASVSYSYVDSSLNLDENSSIDFDGDVNVSVVLNDIQSTFEEITIFSAESDDVYNYVLDYLSSQYITVGIGSVVEYYDLDDDGVYDGYVVASYGDNFYNISIDGDDDDNTISISTYLAGEFFYFEWDVRNDINNTVLKQTDAENFADAVFAVYSSSNERIVGSEDANTDTINLETSFAGLQDSQEHTEAQGGAIYNNSSTTAISIGDIKGDFVVNSANSTSSYAQGGSIYNYADTYDITMGSFNSYFMGNSAFTTASYAQGGAIFNYAESASIDIATIIGDFEKNYTYTLNNDDSKDLDGYGGAIYNYVSSNSNASLSIDGFSGDFTENFVYASNTSAYGGAIYNETYSSLTIGSLLCDFTSNYAAADTDGNAKGGAIYNYAGEGGTLIIDAITANFIDNYVYSKTGSALGGAIYNYAEGGTISLRLSMSIGTMEFTGNYTQNNYVEFDDSDTYTITYNAIYNAADATGTSTIYFQAGEEGSIIVNDGITGDSVAVENQILSINYMDENTEDSLYGTVEFNDLVEMQTISVYNGTLSLGSYEGTTDLLGDGSDISVIASSATLSNSNLSVKTGATLNISGDNVKISSSTVTFESGSSFSVNTSGYLCVDSDSTFDISGITSFSVVYDGSLTLDSSTNTYDSNLIYIEDSDLATSIYESLSAIVDFDTELDDDVDDDGLWELLLNDNTIYLSVDSTFYTDFLTSTSTDTSTVETLSSIECTRALSDVDILVIEDFLIDCCIETAISLYAAEETTTTVSGTITFLSNELALYDTITDFFSDYITDDDALYDFYTSNSMETETKTAIEVNSNNVILAGEIYAKLITEDETDSVVAVKTNTGTLRLAADTVIISEIYDSSDSENPIGYSTAITNSHEEGEDVGLNLILQGSVLVFGDIVANSPFSVTSEGMSELEDGTYTYNVSSLYLYGDLSTLNADGTNESEDITVETASLILEGGTIEAGDGDINLIGGTLYLDEDSSLTTTGDINITTDIYGNMGNFEYEQGATFTNEISISIEGGGVMLVGQELDISSSIDLSAFISADDYKYGDFEVVVDGTTNATSVIVKSLTYFQEVMANNVNEKALAVLLDEMTYTGDFESKLIFKSLLNVSGLDSVMMNNYSNIAEVNSILLSNLNFESVNRARAILAKTAGSYLASITEEEVIEEATGVDLVEAEEVAIIKYSKVAQLQSINLLGSKDSVNGVAGYDYWSVGSLANLDKILSEKALVGVSIGGTYNKTEGDTGDSANSTTFLLNAYGVYANEGLEVFGNIGYAHFWNEGYKSGLNADWDSDAFNALVGVSYDLETTLEGLTITPLAMLNLVYLNSDSANYSDYINVDSQSYLSAKLMLGLEAQYAISERFNSIFRLMYSHECGDTSYDFAYGFSNGLIGELDYIGSEAGADSAIMGIGLSYDFSETCSVYFDYNAYIYSNLITHSLNLSIAIEF